MTAIKRTIRKIFTFLSQKYALPNDFIVITSHYFLDLFRLVQLLFGLIFNFIVSLGWIHINLVSESA